VISIEPIAVDREQAAALLCISRSHFEAHVARGDLPQPRKIGGRAVWLVSDLRDAAHELPVSDLLPPPSKRKLA
jgi:predicted DNA-binding transcriptional regulator AlpA